MPAKTKAEPNKTWSYNIACRCAKCGSSNWISNRSNFWICWNCGRDLSY
jgi:ribosomal protein S14